MIRAAAAKILRKLRGKTERYQQLLLPARHLRLCGSYYKDNAFFVDSARKEVERLQKFLRLSPASRILDIGCGYARLPIGIIATLGDVALYQGLDVDAGAIAWGKRYLTPQHPHFLFQQIDVSNSRYNPNGRRLAPGFRFPLADASFDIVFLFSVFSHMVTEDVNIYLEEIRRVLRPGGGVFLTAFVEEDVPEISINPEGYRRERWKGPLHCVRYNRAFFDGLITASGLKIDRFTHETEMHGQSAYYLSRG